MSNTLRKRSEATLEIANKVLELSKRLEDPSLPTEEKSELIVRIDGYRAMLVPTKELWDK